MTSRYTLLASGVSGADDTATMTVTTRGTGDRWPARARATATGARTMTLATFERIWVRPVATTNRTARATRGSGPTAWATAIRSPARRVVLPVATIARPSGSMPPTNTRMRQSIAG